MSARPVAPLDRFDRRVLAQFSSDEWRFPKKGTNDLRLSSLRNSGYLDMELRQYRVGAGSREVELRPAYRRVLALPPVNERDCKTCEGYLKPRWDCPECNGTGKSMSPNWREEARTKPCIECGALVRERSSPGEHKKSCSNSIDHRLEAARKLVFAVGAKLGVVFEALDEGVFDEAALAALELLDKEGV